MADNNTTNNYQAIGTEENGRVTKGLVTIEKQTPSKKIINFLFSDRLDSVGTYLMQCILRPNLKDLMFKIGMGALQMFIYNGNVNDPNNGGNYIPGYGYQPARRDPGMYNSYSMQPNYAYAQPQPGYYRPNMGINDVVFQTRDDVLLVLDRMRNEIQRYQRVRMADFYTFAGITGQESNWVLQNTGWRNIDAAHPIMRTDGRWGVEFPPPQQL